MSLIGLLIFLVIIGVCLWLLFTYVPMPQAIKTLIIVVSVIVVIVWLLSALGVWSGFANTRLK